MTPPYARLVLGVLSLFCHYNPSKTGEIQGNQEKVKKRLSRWPARGFVDFVRLCEVAEFGFRDRPIQPLSHLTGTSKVADLRA